MFVLSESFPFEVRIALPGGREEVARLQGRWLSRSAFAEYCRAGAETPMVEFIAGLLTGWEDPTPYSHQALAERIAYARPDAAMRIFRAYRDELMGDAETKNSSPPPAAGPAAETPAA